MLHLLLRHTKASQLCRWLLLSLDRLRARAWQRLRARKKHRARLGHSRHLLGRIRARKGRPATLLDEVALRPGINLLERRQVGRHFTRRPTSGLRRGYLGDR